MEAKLPCLTLEWVLYYVLKHHFLLLLQTLDLFISVLCTPDKCHCPTGSLLVPDWLGQSVTCL